MSEHTPTPWTWTKAEGFCECGAATQEEGRHTKPEDCEEWVYEQVANVPEAFDIDMEEYLGLGDTNAARIVACVNAFHSPDGREIATEKITEGLVWRMLDALKIGVRAAENAGLDVTEAEAVLAKLED